MKPFVGGPLILLIDNNPWSIRPFDSSENREMVIEAICRELEKNEGVFPKKGSWIERYEADK
jgi:hypothetical protein